MTQRIEPIEHQDTAPEEGRIPVWGPVIGRELQRYSSTLEDDHAFRLRSESVRILSACVRPGVDRGNAGLVLGYVQSGKTSSFTGVTALARDNGYSLVIIIGGTSNILLKQTEERLLSDLALGAPDVAGRWLHAPSPKIGELVGDTVLRRISGIRQSRLKGEPIAVGIPLITVMKNITHLNNLIDLLEDAAGPDRDGLNGLSALIVDDEAHMHTPNVRKTTEDPSSIYEAMRRLRACLPSHTLLQYTATPQANLLAALDDEFSPDFVRLLGAGPEYAGGKEFFIDHRTATIRPIPASERIGALGPHPTGAPDSLQRAFATFLVICADDRSQFLLDPERPLGPLSFLAHASGSNPIQERITGWLTSLRDSWSQLFDPSGSASDRNALWNLHFQPAYDDLLSTATPPISSLENIRDSIYPVVSQVQIQTINQTGQREVNWGLTPYNVINGGNLLGVGFTVKGLVVTHMMREPGGGQSDTIQQRGRFFGYRKSWLNRTRVWLESTVTAHFVDYVKQEEFLRSDLAIFDSQNLHLRGWKRRFRLNPSMTAKLCRKNAIKIDLFRFTTDRSWIYQSVRLRDNEARSSNLSSVVGFLNGEGEYSGPIQLKATDIAGSGTTDATRHLHGTCDLIDLKTLLSEYVVHDSNRMDFEVVRSLLDEFEDDERYSQVDVFLMAGGNMPNGDGNRYRRRRAVQESGKFDLLQGAFESGPYQGDRQVRNNDRIALQIHRVNHGPNDGQIDDSDVAYIAISIPEVLENAAKSWIQELR